MFKPSGNRAVILLTLILALVLLAHVQSSHAELGEARSLNFLPTPTPYSTQKPGEAQDDTLRVETNLITVPVSVMDRDGRYITNLRKEDFQVFEDGVEQEIAYFEPTEQPFTALLLLDSSGSMKNYMTDLAHAANAFVEQMRPDDQLIIAVFSGDAQIKVVLEATHKRNFKKNIALRTLTGHPTTTFNAVELGIKYMEKFQGRRAIMLFSDGELYGKKASAKSNLRDAEEQEALIYTVLFGPGVGRPRTIFIGPEVRPDSVWKVFDKDIRKGRIEANNYMQGLAQKSGGRSYQINDIANLEKTFRLIADELGQQYSLGYSPKSQPETGQRRQIKVKIRQPNVVVRARDSYLVERARGAKQQ